MAKKQVSGDKTMWTLTSNKSDPLSEQLDDLLSIFNHHARVAGGFPPKFLGELLQLQAERLKAGAQRQELEILALKKELREIKQAVAELKEPPETSLDKAKPGLKAKP